MKKRFLILFILFFCALSQAQECPPTCNAGEYCDSTTNGECVSGNPPPPGLDVPIDSNLSFLLVGGLFIGAIYIFRSYSTRVQ